MQINPDKTETIYARRRYNHSQKKFKNTQSLGVAESIKKVQDVVKIVGVSLDSTLSFDNHVHLVCEPVLSLSHALTETYSSNANSHFVKSIDL